MSEHDEETVSAIGGECMRKVASRTGPAIGSPLECNSLEDFQIQLRRMLETASLALIPPLVTTDLYLNSNASFKASSTAKNSVSSQHEGPNVKNTQAATLKDGAVRDRGASAVNHLSTIEVLKEIDDPKVRIKLQAVVARQIVRAIMDVDGFGYGIQTDFDSKKNGHRFTFGCHDSIWNKGRRRRARDLEKSQEGSKSRCGSIYVPAQRALKVDFDCNSVHASYLQLRWGNHRPIPEDLFEDRGQLRSYGDPSHHHLKTSASAPKVLSRAGRITLYLQITIANRSWSSERGQRLPSGIP